MLRKLLIISVVFSTAFKGFSQQHLISSTLVARLDSVTASAGIASHFALLNFERHRKFESLKKRVERQNDHKKITVRIVK